MKELGWLLAGTTVVGECRSLGGRAMEKKSASLIERDQGDNAANRYLAWDAGGET